MKKCIILTMLLCASVFMLGQEPSSLHVQKMDGTTQIALLVTIEKITFEADVLVLKTSEGEFRLPMGDIRAIRFGPDDTAIEDVETSAIRITKHGNQLQIECDCAIQQLYLVDMSGKVLVSQRIALVDTTSITFIFIFVDCFFAFPFFNLPTKIVNATSIFSCKIHS